MGTFFLQDKNVLPLAGRTKSLRHLSNDKERMFPKQVSVHSTTWHLLQRRTSKTAELNHRTESKNLGF